MAGQIKQLCARTGLEFTTSLGSLGANTLDSYYVNYLDVGSIHPMFSLSHQTTRHILSKMADSSEFCAQQDHKVRALTLVAHFDKTGLLVWDHKIRLEGLSPECIALFGQRVLHAVEWVKGLENWKKLPRFHITSETASNLIPGFLMELEDFRQQTADRRKARDLNAELSTVATAASRRAAQGLKVITPSVALQIAGLIGWLKDDTQIAVDFLTADSHKVLAMLDREELYLADLANLLLDIEVLDWQSGLKYEAINHLRGVVNIYYSINGMTAAQKELFTDTVIGDDGFMDYLGGPAARVVSGEDGSDDEGLEYPEDSIPSEDEDSEDEELLAPVDRFMGVPISKPFVPKPPTKSSTSRSTSTAINLKDPPPWSRKPVFSAAKIEEMKGMSIKEVIAARKAADAAAAAATAAAKNTTTKPPVATVVTETEEETK